MQVYTLSRFTSIFYIMKKVYGIEILNTMNFSVELPWILKYVTSL